MKKYLLLFVLIIISIQGVCQDHFYSLIANSYLIPLPGSSSIMKRINKPIQLTYNRDVSVLFIDFVDGTRSNAFQNMNYTRTIESDGSVYESYISAETNTTPFGHFGIIINFRKEGTNFQISLPSSDAYPNGFTYLVDKAKLYSEIGEVKNNPIIKNYKESLNSLRLQDSLKRIGLINDSLRKAKEKTEEDLYEINKEKYKIYTEENRLKSGNNNNGSNLRWLLDTIASKVNMDENIYFNYDFKISIDEKGKVFEAQPINEVLPEYRKYVPLIRQEIIGRSTEPYKADNGKNYPSFSHLYISLHPKEKKAKKSSISILRSLINF